MLHPNARDITGVRFGKLIAREPTGERRDHKLVWRCDCDCGGSRETTQASLASGHAYSCGCARSEAARNDMIGKVFGRWTVVTYTKSSRWRCRCECGNEADVLTSNLMAGKSRSCGCLRDALNTTHGLSYHSLYKRWHAMLDRCRNPRRKGYDLYGGRGIRVCARWHDFDVFLADVGVPPTPRHSLDRIDADLGYEPGNVRWATQRQQMLNRRSAHDVALERATEAELLAALARKLGHFAPKLGAILDQTRPTTPDNDR